MIQARLQKLRQLLSAQNLQAALLTDMSSVRFFCGFTGSDGILLVTAELAVFQTDSRYTSQARREVCADRIEQYTGKYEGIAGLLCGLQERIVGFDADALSCAAFEKLRQACPTDCIWQPLTKGFKELRGIKDRAEIATMKQAARIAADAFEEILPQIRPGILERDLALALEFAMRRRGAEDKSFPFIVAAGERGALPHGIASERPLQAGELVTFDFGARWQGYCSDETVTLALGDVPARLREVYDTVHQAQQRALALVRPGVPLKEIDAAARDFIAGQGYGDYFGHGLGHGVGLEVHEFPVVSPRSDDIAREGMVFTVEPGIYIPDLGGVRLEDTVHVTAGGYERVTCLCKDFSSVHLA